MELINGLLARYTKLFGDKQLEVGLIIEIIKKQTGLVIKNNELNLKEGILYLKTKPKYRLELILNKQKILDELNRQGLKVLDLK